MPAAEQMMEYELFTWRVAGPRQAEGYMCLDEPNQIPVFAVAAIMANVRRVINARVRYVSKSRVYCRRAREIMTCLETFSRATAAYCIVTHMRVISRDISALFLSRVRQHGRRCRMVFSQLKILTGTLPTWVWYKIDKLYFTTTL